MKTETITLAFAGGLALLGPTAATPSAPPAGWAWQEVKCIPTDLATEERFAVARAIDGFGDHGGFPNSAEAIAGFTRYAVELVRQTRGMVDMFEIWNEWVGCCGMGGQPGTHDGEACGRLLQPTYTAVRREFPDVTVVGIGGEYGAHCAENPSP